MHAQQMVIDKGRQAAVGVARRNVQTVVAALTCSKTAMSAVLCSQK